MYRLPALLLAAALTATTACGNDGGGSPRATGTPSGTPSASPSSASVTPTPTGEENAVTITGVDYGYSVTGTPKQGLTKITFENTGQDFHMAAIARLGDGKTAADALAAIQSDDESDDDAALPSGDSYVDGNPSLLTPGTKTTTYVELAAGKYALICFLRAESDDKPHFEKGMISELTVGTDNATMPEPTATGEIVTTDDKLTLPDLSSGEGTYEYTNNGDKTHGLLFVKLNDTATYESFVAWSDKYFEDEATLADRPGEVWGGLLEVGMGETVWLTLDLPPGKYVALDTEADDDAGANKEFYRDESGGLRAEFTVT